MSIWTHVNGSIRVDCVRMINPITNKKFQEILGKQVNFDDDDWETTMPCGSEGSLVCTILTNPHENSMAAYAVNIHGDLRDYSNVDEIKTWFTDVCAKLGMIRSAILEVAVEGMELVVFRYNKALGELPEVGGIEEVYRKDG